MIIRTLAVALFVNIVELPALAEQYHFSQQQQSRGDYSQKNLPQTSYNQNRWEVGHRYQLDQYGRRILQGQYGIAGQAQRTYTHGGDPRAIQSMQRKEQWIQNEHREYIDYTQQVFARKARREAELELLRRNQSLSPTRQQERIQSNREFQNLDSLVHGIHSKIHSATISGR